MAYPVANYIRVRVTKNILWMMRIYLSQRMSYPVADHVRLRITKNILREGSRECICHKEYPILWQMM